MKTDYINFGSAENPAYGNGSKSNPYNLDAVSLWRANYGCSNTHDSQETSSSLLALPDDSRFTTSLAISKEAPLVAIGSGSYDTNLFFVQTPANGGQKESGGGAPLQKPQMAVKAFFASKFPIYSLSFQSNLLITGTERSAAVLYQISKSQLVSGGADSSSKDTPIVRCVGTYKNKAAKSIETAAAGNHISTRRVHIVSFSPGTDNDSNRAQMSLDSSPDDYWPPSSIDAKSNIFFSCLGGTVNVWDTSVNTKALRIEKLSSQPLSAAEWSPHAPYNLIFGGSVDGTINAFDLRKRGRGIVFTEQHGSSKVSINDLAISPFVPYFLATASDDGTTNIWDLRFASSGKPAAVVGKNMVHGSATKLCWSKNYVDLLAIGSSDRHVRLFNLRPNSFAIPNAEFNHSSYASSAHHQYSSSHSNNQSNSYVLQPTKVSSFVVSDRIGAEDIGAIVGLVNGPSLDSSNQEVYYSLSDCGDLYSHSINQSLLYNTAPHLMNKSIYPNEYRAESLVYSRDIASASISAINFVDSLLLTQKDKKIIQNIIDSSSQIRQLCSLFKAKLAISNDSWKFPTQTSKGTASSLADIHNDDEKNPITDPAVIQQKFAENLADLCYGLPPGYSLEDIARKEPSVMSALEKLNMTNLCIKLHDLISEFKKNENDKNAEQLNASICQKLISREQQLITYLKIQPLLFDTELLKDVAKIILSHDCLRGLSLGVKICETYFLLQKKGIVKCTDLNSLVHVLLAPTIFDPEEPDASKSVDPTNTGSSSSPNSIPEADGATPSYLNAVQIRSRIRSYLAINPLIVLEMVKLEIKVQETVLKGGDQVKVADRIIQHMSSHSKVVKTLIPKSAKVTSASSSNPDFMFSYLVSEIRSDYPSTVTLSAAATRLYLNALIQMRAYDEYLANVKFWLPNYPSRLTNYPLTQVLAPQTYEVVVPRFKRQLDVVVSTINKEPLGLEPRIYRDIIMKLANALTRGELDKTELGMGPTKNSNDPAAKAPNTQQLETNKKSSSQPPSNAQQKQSNLLTIDQVKIYFDTISKAFISVLEALYRHNSESQQRASREVSPLVACLVDILSTYKSDEIASFIEAAKKYQSANTTANK
ncbi:Peroxisomal targeting signal 2 receptor [Smittium culicis]|uniref:Peroxisomal targeting signal 2 receptor n=1 Tax=Smittium culicis TaxID=133412 RepID=A0A1R1YJ55_9FUNG|nr:Peroxisomal targeting signal 2 receptor [Smittium culicis]